MAHPAIHAPCQGEWLHFFLDGYEVWCMRAALSHSYSTPYVAFLSNIIPSRPCVCSYGYITNSAKGCVLGVNIKYKLTEVHIRGWRYTHTSSGARENVRSEANNKFHWLSLRVSMPFSFGLGNVSGCAPQYLSAHIKNCFRTKMSRLEVKMCTLGPLLSV